MLAACAGSSTAAPPPSASPAQTTAACAADQAGQFDFWVGSWKATWTDASGAATATDLVATTGCEIDETFAADRFLGNSNYSATSRSTWDPALGKWVQDYRDNVGERSRWLGCFTSGAMTLIGPQVGSRQQRVIWHDIHADHWTWEYDSSTDGSHWSPQLVLTYARS